MSDKIKKLLNPKDWGLLIKLSVLITTFGTLLVLGLTVLTSVIGPPVWWQSLLILIGTVVIGVLISVYAGRRIMAPLITLTSSIETMKILKEADNRNFYREDELGQLAQKVFGMISQLDQENQKVKNVLEGMSKATTQLTQYSTEILTIAHEQATGANEQATAIQEAFTTSKEIAVTAKEIANNAVSVTRVAENADGACKNGNVRVGSAIEGMKEVKNQVSSLADKMLNLGKSNQKIGKVVDIIDEISERTNLLALNAAIEAAGAGSAGKRFGIVASEIRRLAEKTVEATLQIKNLINSMQEVTNSTIMSTEQAIHSVGESYQLVQDVGEALESISELVQRTSKAAREISFSTQQQTSASEQMSVAIAEVNEVAEHFVKGSEETTQAIEELSSLSKNLTTMVKED